MGEQLSMFEPTGAEAVALAQLHQRRAEKLRTDAHWLDAMCMQAAARQVLNLADAEDNTACVFLMLAEFEALGGVA